ncbi:hypothetical protein [Lignipirellula cremea]|uniref:Uncharacterized protein n=1 Tax=Lignipirellula cremea TaxID=2528010 RepID=A0A518DL61_9BACT|nr:hypothetical protein [Lignipirellula cremea]QDU92575.1 hypothetical protein Pla8534_03230 [Lignipirellula cremea]
MNERWDDELRQTLQSEKTGRPVDLTDRVLARVQQARRRTAWVGLAAALLCLLGGATIWQFASPDATSPASPLAQDRPPANASGEFPAAQLLEVWSRPPDMALDRIAAQQDALLAALEAEAGPAIAEH